MAGGTYIKKETPGGLQSNLKTRFLSLLLKFTSNLFHFSVTNVWTADDRKNGRNVGKPIRAPSPISQTLNNNAVKAYRGTPQNPGGGSPSVFTFIQTLRI